MAKTPDEIAEEWYQVDHVYQSLQRAGDTDFAWAAVPSDNKSRAFAEWLTSQLRRAMTMGIRIGRSIE